MCNWMIDWLRAWEKATRPACEEDCHVTWSGLRFNEDGYLEVDPIPAGADPIWQPNGYLLTDHGWLAFCAPWLVWLNEDGSLPTTARIPISKNWSEWRGHYGSTD